MSPLSDPSGRGCTETSQNPPYGVFRRRRPGGSSSPDRVAQSVATGLLAAQAYYSPREMYLDDIVVR
jgi:hypothetical protein